MALGSCKSEVSHHRVRCWKVYFGSSFMTSSLVGPERRDARVDVLATEMTHHRKLQRQALAITWTHLGLAGLAAVVVGLSAGCGSSGSNKGTESGDSSSEGEAGRKP